MIGDAIITLLDHDEQYVITFPSAFGRSILGVPWFEMGEFCRIDGEWNGIMNAKYSDTKISEVFFDTKATPVIKKIVRPIIDQDTNESRR
ncbi:unnamed protein product, partial [Adineta steineri]